MYKKRKSKIKFKNKEVITKVGTKRNKRDTRKEKS